MNCDDVFDALTDPLTLRKPTAQLEAHLAGCPRCRQMREVIEPARSLLCGELPIERVPGSEHPSDTGRMSEKRPLLTLESVGMAEAIASQLAAGSRKNRPRRWSLANPRLLAVVRGTALVLFGAVAVYCLEPRDRESDLHALAGRRSGTCVDKNLHAHGVCTERPAIAKRAAGRPDVRRLPYEGRRPATSAGRDKRIFGRRDPRRRQFAWRLRKPDAFQARATRPAA